VALTSCGGGSPPVAGGGPIQPSTEFLYTLASTGSPPNISTQLLSFKLDTGSGTLTNTGAIAWNQLYPNFAIDPASKYLYASALGAPAWSIFSLDATTGAPSAAGGLYLPPGICVFCQGGPPSNPGAVAMDASGAHLFYGSSSFGIAQQQIGELNVNGATGALTVTNGSPFPANQMPFVVVVHPSRRFVYTEDLSTTLLGGFQLQSVSGYAVDPNTSALTPVPGSPFSVPANSGVLGFVMHPSGKFVYAMTGTLNGTSNGILAWSVDGATGTLTPLASSPFQTGTAAFFGSVDPLGKFLYASGGAAGGILGFSINGTTGDLSPLAGSPFSTGSVLAGPTVDALGRYLFATDFRNNTIVEFTVNSSGALNPSGSPTALTGHPGFLMIVKAPSH
jgi:6-phosphogluconolactonase